MSKVEVLNVGLKVHGIVREDMVIEHGTKVKTHDGSSDQAHKIQELLVDDKERRDYKDTSSACDECIRSISRFYNMDLRKAMRAH